MAQEHWIPVGSERVRVVYCNVEGDENWFVDWDTLRAPLGAEHEAMPSAFFEILMARLSATDRAKVGKEIRAVAQALRRGIGKDRGRELAVAEALDAWVAPATM